MMGAVKSLSNNVRTYGYFRWMCDLIETTKTVNSYSFLLKKLHATPFVVIIDRDVDRVLDGKLLRNDYFGAAPSTESGRASVLEVLIGIAQRLNDMDMEEVNANRTAKWFWELINNLTLDKFTDDVWYEYDVVDDVEDILNTFIERKYLANGVGGLFPLKEPSKNQANVEIWYQMSEYLQEKYVY